MAKIEILKDFILHWEGGFVNDPHDSGGATNKGVTIATWRRYGYDKDGDGDIDIDDLKLITADDAVNRVMKPVFWDKWQADNIKDQSVANILVDWIWCSGQYGIRIPQTLLGVKADGVVGPKTLAALNACNGRTLFTRLWRERKAYYERVAKKGNNKKFLGGWINRLNAIGYGSLTYGKPVKKHTF